MSSASTGPSPDQGPINLTREAIALAKAGDPEGLHYLYVRYADDVLRYVNGLIRDHHEAEDITQNVFAKLMKAIKKYEERAVPFDAWILRVARNAALDHLRAKRAIPTEEVRLTDTGRARPRSTVARPCVRRWKTCPRISVRCWCCGTSSASRRWRSPTPSTRARARSTASTIAAVVRCGPT